MLCNEKEARYCLITGYVLQESLIKWFAFLQGIFNAVFRTGYYPGQWKVSQIIMI